MLPLFKIPFIERQVEGKLRAFYLAHSNISVPKGTTLRGAYHSKNITFGEVFAGIGAANAAFLPLGWKNEFFIENDPISLAQYLYNWDDEFHEYIKANQFNRAQVLFMASKWKSKEKLGDIYPINAENIKLPSVDVLMTSPPCQSFSVGRYTRGMGLEERGLLNTGDLFFETHALIKRIKPKVFILENVPGMLSARETPAFDAVCNKVHPIYKWNWPKRGLHLKKKGRSTFYEIILPSLGYKANEYQFKSPLQIPVWREKLKKVVLLDQLPYRLFFVVVSPTRFGIPMDRKRVFVVGFRKGEIGAEKFQFNLPLRNTIPMRNVFEYVDPMAKMSDAFRFKELNRVKRKKVGADKRITPDGFYVREGADPVINTFTTRIDSRRIVIEMQSGNYRDFADAQRRKLLGFPEDFSADPISVYDIARNYGNTISVDVLRHIGEQIQLYL